MQFVPSEVALWGVYFPPLFLASLLGIIAAVVTALSVHMRSQVRAIGR